MVQLKLARILIRTLAKLLTCKTCRVHADCHDLWIDPTDGRHMVIGGDGGFYVTYDRGTNWDHINTAAVGQFYHVAISPKHPYWVVGGLQDHGSWGGPAISKI